MRYGIDQRAKTQTFTDDNAPANERGTFRPVYLHGPSDWEGVSAHPRPDYWALVNIIIVAFAAGFLVGLLA